MNLMIPAARSSSRWKACCMAPRIGRNHSSRPATACGCITRRTGAAVWRHRRCQSPAFNVGGSPLPDFSLGRLGYFNRPTGCALNPSGRPSCWNCRSLGVFGGGTDQAFGTDRAGDAVGGNCGPCRPMGPPAWKRHTATDAARSTASASRRTPISHRRCWNSFAARPSNRHRRGRPGRLPVAPCPSTGSTPDGLRPGDLPPPRRQLSRRFAAE